MVEEGSALGLGLEQAKTRDAECALISTHGFRPFLAGFVLCMHVHATSSVFDRMKYVYL